jgi:hypothetical protein
MLDGNKEKMLTSFFLEPEANLDAGKIEYHSYYTMSLNLFKER